MNLAACSYAIVPLHFYRLSCHVVRTGLLAVDEQLEWLKQTGYMHTHARMWVAGFVCNFVTLYWLENAKRMYYHFLDGDLASNMLSWQWVAGDCSTARLS